MIEDRKVNKERIAELLGTKSGNVIDLLEKTEVANIGRQVLAEYEVDLGDADYQARVKIWDKAEKLCSGELEQKDWPYEKSANVKYPLMKVAAIQFGARAYPEIVQGNTVCKPKILGTVEEPPLPPEAQQMIQQGQSEDQIRQQLEDAGQIPKSKLKRAQYVCEYINYQLFHEVEEWEHDTDQLTNLLPLWGTMFRSVYFSQEKNRICTDLLTPKQLVMPYRAKSVRETPRATKEYTLFPIQIRERMRSGFFGEFSDFADEEKEVPEEFVEQYKWLDLDEDGFKEPYIVTVHKKSAETVRISPNFSDKDVEINEEDFVTKIHARQYFVKYSFFPATDGSIYDQGFYDLLYHINQTANTILNQLLDAGTLQNSNTGAITSESRLGRKGAVRLKLGELLTVKSNGQDIRKSIYHFDYPGPSQTLYSLLGFVIESGKEVANLKEVLEGQTQHNMQPTTVMALIEQGMKVYSGIYKRIHRSLSKELSLIRAWNAEIRNPTYRVLIDDNLKREDFEDAELDFVPMSDPQVTTDLQKQARAQFKMQFVGNPNIKQPELIEQIWEAANVDGYEQVRIDADPQVAQLQQQLQQMGEQMQQMQKALKDDKFDKSVTQMREEREDFKATTDAKRAATGMVKDMADAESKEPGNQLGEYQRSAEEVTRNVTM